MLEIPRSAGSAHIYRALNRFRVARSKFQGGIVGIIPEEINRCPDGDDPPGHRCSFAHCGYCGKCPSNREEQKPLDPETIRARHAVKLKFIEEGKAVGVEYSVAALQDVADMETLLTEVERLTRICKATNPCSYCGTLQLILREGAPVIGDVLIDKPAGRR